MLSTGLHTNRMPDNQEDIWCVKIYEADYRRQHYTLCGEYLKSACLTTQTTIKIC